MDVKGGDIGSIKGSPGTYRRKSLKSAGLATLILTATVSPCFTLELAAAMVTSPLMICGFVFWDGVVVG